MRLFEDKSNKGKTIPVTHNQILAAWKRVRAAGGSGGVEGRSLSDVENNLKDELYKLWNRMSSGSYFPMPVLGCMVPKVQGGKRLLGIPTIVDRIAQQVVKDLLEPSLELYFHKDSYGYRPGRNTRQAVELCTQRCYDKAWVIDLDIKGFFDNLDHEMLMLALQKHTDEKWILMYVERWLKAPMQLEGETLKQRDRGTPQGGVISPLLANLFLHYAFDKWISITHPHIEFERYADDIVVHCSSKEEALQVLSKIRERLQICKLELHPEKTKIVYCKKYNRQRDYPLVSFDFLGFTYKPRTCKAKEEKYYLGFGPAISTKAQKQIVEEIKRRKLHSAVNAGLQDLANELASSLQGWINYYGRFRRWSMQGVFRILNDRLVKWLINKHRNLRDQKRKARLKLKEIAKDYPNLFVHWRYGFLPG
jgi:group II intron reverse transcriptase/maturase